jgi:tetratricopeptide (TPR) repeat protein
MNRIAVVLLCLSLSCFAQDSPQQLMQQALAAQQAGRFEEAIRDYRVLVKQYPNIFEIRSNLGAALAGEGQYTEAIAEYEKALTIQSNPTVRLNLALSYYKSGDFEKTRDTLKQVHAEQPANMQVIELLGDCYLRFGENQEVITLLTSIQNAYPDNDAVTYLLSTALVRDGQSAKGQKLIDRILRNGDSAEARMLMGTTEYMAGDYSRARADLQKAIQLNPHLPGVYAYYGKTLLKSGDQTGGQKALEEALQLDPNDFISNLDMGLLLRQIQDDSGAMKYFQHALQVHPGDPGVRFEIASTEAAQGQLPEAAGDLESLLKDEPDFREAVWQLANVYIREGRRADGERERALYMKLSASRQADGQIAAKGSK